MTRIKVCENNYGYGTNDVLKRIKSENPHLDVETALCWGYCDDCASGPYVFVNDQEVYGDTTDELYENVKKLL